MRVLFLFSLFVISIAQYTTAEAGWSNVVKGPRKAVSSGVVAPSLPSKTKKQFTSSANPTHHQYPKAPTIKINNNVTKGAAFSKVATTTPKQLQKKFKHAGDFGVEGSFNKANAQKFNQAIQKHMNSSGTKEIQGTYRGNSVTFHTNPNNGLTVIQNQNGSFLSGWRLNPKQLQHVLKDGKL